MASSSSGNIYDLGYQKYLGPRLGRRHAAWALYTQSLRVIFGIGRSGWAKLTAFGILGIVLVPAFVQLAVGAFSSDAKIVAHHDFYTIIEPLSAIFCALVAPELIGRDQRSKTLSLYFSRALRREDYAVARYAAFFSSLLIITLVPQLLMYVGNAAASGDTLDNVRENWKDLPAIVASGVLLSGLAAGISLTVASLTARRAYATVAIAAVFLLTSGIAATVFEVASPSSGRFALLLSPFEVGRGLTFWIFGVTQEDQLLEAGFFGGVYVLDAIVVSLVALAFVIVRYRRVSA